MVLIWENLFVCCLILICLSNFRQMI
uniref:Uncharacterized protein n=1 Tax=Rhizophora mucronata TaxID=61149 RepID=A0A2P2PGY9_RHIMU